MEHELKVTSGELAFLLCGLQLLHEQTRMAAARPDKVGKHASKKIKELDKLGDYLRMAAGIDEEKK